MKKIKKVTIEFEDNTQSEIEFTKGEHFSLELDNLFTEVRNEQHPGVIKRSTGERTLKLIIAPEAIIDNL